MKNLTKGLLTCMLMLFFLNACEKENIRESEISDSNSPTLQFRTNPTPNNGIYVNDFRDEVLLINDEDDKLLTWSKQHGYSHVTLYTVSAILENAVNTAKLQDFVKKAKVEYGLGVTFVACCPDVVDKIKVYFDNNSQEPDHLPTGIATEYEFWKEGDPESSNTLAEYMIILDKIKQLDAAYGPLDIYLYILKFDGYDVYECTAERMKRVLLWIQDTGSDHIYLSLVNYRQEAQIFPLPGTNLFDRMQDMANVLSLDSSNEVQINPELLDCYFAPRLDMRLNVVILFNVRYSSDAADIFDYFNENTQDHEFYEAYTSFYSGFINSTMVNKDRLNLVGWQIYRYSEAFEARGL